MIGKQFSNFNLLTIRYPFTAIISLLHRLSGVIIFLLIPSLLWLLATALASETGFGQIHTILQHLALKFILWVIWVALGYHFLAGIRHLLMDYGVGESLSHARKSGAWVIIFTAIFAIFTGLWLW